jgi:hypothetical protein
MVIAVSVVLLLTERDVIASVIGRGSRTMRCEEAAPEHQDDDAEEDDAESYDRGLYQE